MKKDRGDKQGMAMMCTLRKITKFKERGGGNDGMVRGRWSARCENEKKKALIVEGKSVKKLWCFQMSGRKSN